MDVTIVQRSSSRRYLTRSVMTLHCNDMHEALLHCHETGNSDNRRNGFRARESNNAAVLAHRSAVVITV